MVSCCVAVGCRMRAQKGCKVTFHRFPVRLETREKWVRALKRKNFTPSKNSRLCEKHFTPNSYNYFHGRKFLKENAIPSIFDFSQFISETNIYKPGNPEISPAAPVTSSADNSGSINCIQFVDVDSLKCTSIPYTSNQTVVIIETNSPIPSPNIPNLADSTESNLQDLEIISPEDPIGSPNNEGVSDMNKTRYSATEVKPIDSINAPSTSKSTNNCHSIQLQTAAFRNRNAEIYSSSNSKNDWRRQQFIIKAKEMRNKYCERLKIMNRENQQLRKRKAFLENLLIRIKEKQLTCYDDNVDLLDCFVEEDSWESDEDSSDDMNSDIQDQIFSMIDDKITKADELVQNDESKEDECEAFGAYVESMLNVMSEKDAIAVRNQITERVNVYKGKRLINMFKKFNDAFSGLENIEID